MGFFGAAPVVGNKLYADLDLNGYDIIGAGTVQGGAAVVATSSATVTVTAAQCYGSVFRAEKSDGGQEFDLPVGVVGMLVHFIATEAQILTIDPDAGDNITINGTTKSDGVAITSAGVGNEIISLLFDSTAGWTVIGYSGGWA